MKLALTFSDVLLVPQYSSIRSRSEVSLATTIAPGIDLDVPLLSASMSSVTSPEVALAMSQNGALGMLPRFERYEDQAKKIKQIVKKKGRVIGSIGVKEDYLEGARLLIEAGACGITLDIAHAHCINALEVISAFKNAFPKVPMIAGTVATYQGTKDLLKAGADTIRIGVGGGTICTTRIVAGSGMPQITAFQEAVRAKKALKRGYILADGGMTGSGDIVKALATGVDGAICGSLFAASNEGPGELIVIKGVKYKSYNGSTSLAEKKRQMAYDKSRRTREFALHVEGVEAQVKVTGSIKDILDSLTAGLKSGFSYSGAHNLAELWKNAEFVQITSAGLRESHSHDVILK
jgi:IMP dehydrogenase